MKKQFLQLSACIAVLFSLVAVAAPAQWNVVGPVGGPGFNVFCMKTMGANLYAGGGGGGVAKWDGTSWTSLSPQVGNGNLGINCMVVFNGELYVGGDIDTMGGVYIDPTVGVAKWNGTTWSQVGSATATNLSGVTNLVVYNGDLYASGNYGVNKWDGTTWTSIGDVDGPANVTLAVYQNALYAASSFSHIGTTHMTIGKGFAKWDGTSWTALPGFFDTLSVLPNINVAKAAGMIVFKNELYVLGSLDYAGTTYVRGAARWNGTSWSGTNGGFTGNGQFMSCFTSIDSSNLYVVGPIQKVNSTNDSVYLSAYWNGTQWHHMFGGNAPYTSFVATENYQGKIYSAWQSLVRWDGTTSVVKLPEAEQLKLYPNPSNGIFHISLKGNEETQIRVMNTLGQVVCNEQIATGVVDHVINLGNAVAGVYYVQVSEGRNVETTRIVIAK